MEATTNFSFRTMTGFVVRPQTQVMCRPHDKGALLVDRRSGACFELNRLGAQIWNLLDGERTLFGVSARLLPTVDIPELRLAQDLLALVNALVVANLVDLNELGPRDRFLVTQLGSESIVTDLARGAYFRANASATRMFNTLTTGAASQDSQQTTDALLDFATGTTPPTPDEAEQFAFRPYLGHFRLFDRGRPLLDVKDTEGVINFIAPIAAESVSRDVLERWLRIVGTKLLAHKGLFCLHASSVVIRDQVLAIAGRSGAGKTTTAQAFAAGGGTLLTEDLLCLEHLNGQFQIRPNAEQQLRGWACETATTFHDQGLRTVNATGLGDAVTQGGPTRTLDKIWVVAANRRQGGDFLTERLAPLDAFIEVLPHIQLGSDRIQAWHSHMANASALALGLPIYKAAAPDGLAALAAAAATYAENTTS